MTNQEAISVLESINAKTDYFLINDDARAEAIDIAISALQAQDVPDTNVGDMISRQAAIDVTWEEPTYTDPLNVLTEVRDKISALPSAQPDIIRCKDCKWWSNDDYRECSSPNYDDGYVTPAGFYCGYAERKDDE